MRIKETKTRSFFKAISWRITATITTIILVYAFTGKIELALTLGIIEVIVKLLIFYLHERIWLKVRYGINYDVISNEKLDDLAENKIENIIN